MSAIERARHETQMRLESNQELSRTVGGIILNQVMQRNYAKLPLTPDESALQATLYRESIYFFEKGPEHAVRYSDGELTNGYRPPESAYNNGDPVAETDVNDSFLYWNELRGREIPHNHEITSFLRSLEQYRLGSMNRIMSELFSALKTLYSYNGDLHFEDASVLQVNSFNRPSARELLQTEHEDGVFATVIWTSAAGLEVNSNERFIPVTTQPGEIVVMPGGIMQHMTGGEITPLYHRARNFFEESLGRKSIMYFSCPNVHEGPIPPYVLNETNYFTKAVTAIREGTEMFGLPKDFVNSARKTPT